MGGSFKVQRDLPSGGSIYVGLDGADNTGKCLRLSRGRTRIKGKGNPERQPICVELLAGKQESAARNVDGFAQLHPLT